MTIGETIKFYREKFKITQDDLAVILNTTPQNIYKYEKGIITNIPINTIIDIAEYFQIPPSKIVGWDEDEAEIQEDTPALPNSALQKEVGQKIRSNRSTNELSLKDLAGKSDLSSNELRDVEVGKFEILQFSSLKTIAKTTQTSTETLINLSPEQEKENKEEEKEKGEQTKMEIKTIKSYLTEKDTKTHKRPILQKIHDPNAIDYQYEEIPESFKKFSVNPNIAYVSNYELSYDDWEGKRPKRK